MNFLKRLAFGFATKGTDLSLTDAAGWSLDARTISGVGVNDTTQFRIAAAFSAIRLIGETVGTLPLHLIQKDGGKTRYAEDHPLYPLVRHQPNDNMTAVEWKEAMAVGLATEGQAYNYVSRFESSGRIFAIAPVPKVRCRPYRRADGLLEYRYTTLQGRQLVLDRRDVCPIRGFGNVQDLEGLPPHVVHRESLGMTLAVERYGAQFFGSGGRPLGVLENEGADGGRGIQTPEQLQETRKKFAQRVREFWANGEMPVLPKGLKYRPVSTPNNDAQFIETRKQQTAEIARIYRVPLHMLMEMDKASYNNSEQANKHFLDYTLMPYLVRIEQALYSCLLTPEEQRKGYRFKFDVRHLLRGDAVQRSQYYVSMRMAGALTPNEVRDLEDLDRVDGADDLHIPLNMAPIDLMRQIQMEKAGV